MALISSFRDAQVEVGVVLQSGIFDRAPSLESFFQYICERQLRGEAEQLKEYSIAVEALGRAADFDPKKDSIVRVEAHRLRSRLGKYYAGPGADHKIHISIPLGSYAPQFEIVVQAPTILKPELTASSAEVIPVGFESQPCAEQAIQHPTRFQLGLQFVRTRALLVFIMILTLVGLIGWRIVSSTNALAQLREEVWQGVPGEAIPVERRILAGYHGEPFEDVQGRDWYADAYFSGGLSKALPKGLVVQGLPTCFVKTYRTGKFRYDVPVREGNYEVHLYFAETEYGVGNPKGGGDGSRMFRLAINGRNEIGLFDVHAEAGGANRLFSRVFKDVSPASDGKIHILFDPITDMAFVNAIEILPSAPGRIRPIRIVAQDHSVTDSDGQLWAADEYVMGGTMVVRRNARFQDRNFALYQGERYGNFTYHIPLAPGKYRLTLHFAETWFGTPSSEIDRNSHRLFEIYSNGVALVRKFDVLGEAGGPDKGIEKVFDGLEPNAQGELALQFVPLANYAEVNAIEIVETE
jgi:hypothetical protein